MRPSQKRTSDRGANQSASYPVRVAATVAASRRSRSRGVVAAAVRAVPGQYPEPPGPRQRPARLPRAGPATGTSAQPSTGTSAGGDLKIGVAYDVGGRGDQSFNDAAAAGVDKFKAESGASVQEAAAVLGESDDRPRGAASPSWPRAATTRSSSLGFVYATALSKVAPQYPDTNFAIVDSTDAKGPNIANLTFAEDQGSFLVGVAAALKSKTRNVGFVGGVDTPLINKFERGFKAGVPPLVVRERRGGSAIVLGVPRRGCAAALGRQRLDQRADQRVVRLYGEGGTQQERRGRGGGSRSRSRAWRRAAARRSGPRPTPSARRAPAARAPPADRLRGPAPARAARGPPTRAAPRCSSSSFSAARFRRPARLR